MEGIEEMAVNEWSIGLSGLTGEQIKKGLDTWQESWPPSLPEFREACTGASVDWEHKSPAYVESVRALPAPLCKPEIANECRDKLKSMGFLK